MPTRRSPNLTHPPFSHAEAADKIGRCLNEQRDRLLELVGFYDEYGRPESWTAETARNLAEAEAWLGSLVGDLLTVAAMVALEESTPPSTWIATLKAIAVDPSLVARNNVDPVARAAAAWAYWLRNGSSDQEYFEILNGTFVPDQEDLRSAAVEAATHFAGLQRSGRIKSLARELLAERLGAAFRGMRDGVIRRSVSTISASGEGGGREQGPFVELLDLVLPCLRGVLPPNAGVAFATAGILKAVMEQQRQLRREGPAAC